jgi:hypothetical protein
MATNRVAGLVSSNVNFKVPSPKVTNVKLPSIQQQLAIVNNPVLRQIYLTQRNVAAGQSMSRHLAGQQSPINSAKPGGSVFQ